MENGESGQLTSVFYNHYNLPDGPCLFYPDSGVKYYFSFFTSGTEDQETSCMIDYMLK